MSTRFIKQKLLCLILPVVLFCFNGLLYAAEQEIEVKEIKIVGNTLFSLEELKPFVKAYEGKSVTFADLQKAASVITNEYRKQGYILAKAYIPEQKIIAGVVEIAVLEGSIGEIKVEGSHKYYSSEFIKKHFNFKNNIFNQNDIERAILVLNEYPRLKVKATLQAGKEPATTDIIITAENAMPVNLTLDYNNFGSKYVSRSRFGATFDVGNLFMEGAIFSIRGVSGDNPDDMLFARASYSIPLNTLGTRLGAYYAIGDYELGREFAVLKMKGKIESYGIYVSHPFIRKRLQSLTAELGFDAKNITQEILGTEVSKDKIRSLRGGIAYESTDTTGRSLASLFITQGLGNNLGGMDNNSRFASRHGADNRFTKANIDVMRIQRILPPVFLILKGTGQWALDSLVATEQFSIGGADTVRGYPLGEFSGDDGYNITGEFRISPLENKEIAQLALFIDHGWYNIKNPAVGQTKSDSLTGSGAGLRFNLPHDINIRFDVGFPIDPSRSSEGSKPIYYLQVVKKF